LKASSQETYFQGLQVKAYGSRKCVQDKEETNNVTRVEEVLPTPGRISEFNVGQQKYPCRR
jgi:hypothetical protein